MIKLFKGVVQQLLLVMAYLSDRGYSMQDVRRGMEDEWGGRVPNQRNGLQTPENWAAVRGVMTALEEGVLEQGTFSSLFDDLVLTLKAKGKHSQDLIDALVDVVKSPYSRNVLSGNALSALRKALLLPDEMAGLTQRLRKREMACAMCGHEFQQGETVTIYSEREAIVIVCCSCYFPSLMRCSKCSGCAEIPQKLRDGLNGARKCEECKHPKPKEKELEGVQLDVLLREGVEVLRGLGGVDEGHGWAERRLQGRPAPLQGHPAAPPGPPMPRRAEPPQWMAIHPQEAQELYHFNAPLPQFRLEEERVEEEEFEADFLDEGDGEENL